jgi:hypothetical protein
MRAVGLCLSLLLTGCLKPEETAMQRAERHFDYLESKEGSTADLCRVSREGKAAAVDENAEETDFIRWSQRELRHCVLDS